MEGNRIELERTCDGRVLMMYIQIKLASEEIELMGKRVHFDEKRMLGVNIVQQYRKCYAKLCQSVVLFFSAAAVRSMCVRACVCFCVSEKIFMKACMFSKL